MAKFFPVFSPKTNVFVRRDGKIWFTSATAILRISGRRVATARFPTDPSDQDEMFQVDTRISLRELLHAPASDPAERLTTGKKLEFFPSELACVVSCLAFYRSVPVASLFFHFSNRFGPLSLAANSRVSYENNGKNFVSESLREHASEIVRNSRPKFLPCYLGAMIARNSSGRREI